MSRALGLFMDALCVKDADTGICRVNTTVHRVNTVVYAGRVPAGYYNLSVRWI